MSEKHTVAMFIHENGERTQVGWASPAENGVRTWEFSPGFEHVKLRDVSFEDDLNSQQIATEQSESRQDESVSEPVSEPEGVVEETVEDEEAPLPVEPVEVAPDPEEAAEPVEMDSGGMIVDVSSDDEKTEEVDDKEEGWPYPTRRSFRENEESN